MQSYKVLQVIVLAAAILLEDATDASTVPTLRFCGRRLSEALYKVCYQLEKMSWYSPTVDQPGVSARRKRNISQECCINRCTLMELAAYCPWITESPSSEDDKESHIIDDRSAEQATPSPKDVPPPEASAAAAAVAAAGPAVGSTAHAPRPRKRGYGRGRKGRCWCRRKRRSGRRRASSIGNMDFVRSAEPRAAPVVGTVSPVITWGRTLNTDPYAYVVYTH